MTAESPATGQLEARLAVLTTLQEGDARERLRKVVARGAFEDFSDYPLDGENALVERVIDALLAAFPVLSRTTSPDAATEELQADRDSLEDRNTQLGNQLVTALDERDAALNAIERVRALHHEDVAYADDSYGPEDLPEDFERHYCGEDGEDWPCPTIAALDGAPEPETPELFPGTNAALDRLTVRKAAPAEAFCIEHGNFHAVELGDPTCEFEDGLGEPVDGEKP